MTTNHPLYDGRRPLDTRDCGPTVAPCTRDTVSGEILQCPDHYDGMYQDGHGR